MIPIVPAFIPATEADVRQTLARVAFANEIHLDVVDGNLVEAISWPYDPAGDPQSVKSFTDQFTLEVHLMVADPLPAAVQWITAGADMILFHTESVTLENFKSFEEFSHVSVGICCYGDTPIETLLAYAEYADYVQLMGITEIGAKGQPFDASVLDNITAVRAALPEKMISVDGHVGSDTIIELKEAGATRFVANSAILGQPDPAAAHAALQALITTS